MWENAPRLYGLYSLLGLCGGYALVMFFNPVRRALGDGFRCLARYNRIWIAFALLGLGYFVFQFVTFTPIRNWSDLDLDQIASLPQWYWPRFAEIWKETPLPALEGVAGVFDNATTTYPFSVVAAVFLLLNWRGLHGALVRALRKRYGFWGYVIYFVVLVSAVAALLKPIVFWRLPEWGASEPAARLLRLSATVDAVAFIFEYLFGVYIQVYLITVCLAWIKGLSFGEQDLFGFAMRRFSYVLEWAGIVVIVSTVIVRGPLLLAYFMNVPDVLDYLPGERFIMCALIIAFCSMQVPLVLHNETLRAAFQAHREFVRTNLFRLGWFLLIAAIHYFFLITCDAIVRGAIADRTVGVIAWKIIYVSVRGLVTGWLLASWVCLFRQCENRRVAQETWIQSEIQY